MLQGGRVTGVGGAPLPHARVTLPKLVRAGFPADNPKACATTEPLGVPADQAMESEAVAFALDRGSFPVRSTRRVSPAEEMKA